MFGFDCIQCGIHSWNVPDNWVFSWTYCKACGIQWEQDRCRGRLAQVASAPFGSCVGGFTDAVVACLAGDLDLIPRDRRRHALLVYLSSPGLLQQFKNEWDRSDYGPVIYRRNLLEKIITFLA